MTSTHENPNFSIETEDFKPELPILQNPWSVKDLEEFLYFCCPECDTKDQSKELFLKHALDKHPDSREILINIQIKKELFDDQSG